MNRILTAMLLVCFALSASVFALTPGKYALGIDTAIGNIGGAAVPSLVLRYDFTSQISGNIGVNYNSYKTGAGVTTSQTGLAARVNYYLPMGLGAAAPFIGVQYSTDGVAAGATSMLGIVLGSEIEVVKGVVLAAGLIPYSSASAGGVNDAATSTGAAGPAGRGVFLSFATYLN